MKNTEIAQFLNIKRSKYSFEFYQLTPGLTRENKLFLKLNSIPKYI